MPPVRRGRSRENAYGENSSQIARMIQHPFDGNALRKDCQAMGAEIL